MLHNRIGLRQDAPTSRQDQDFALGISSALEAPWYMLSFSHVVEARYLADTKLDRMRYQRRAGLLGLLAFFGVLPTDAEMLPDVFPLAVSLRSGTLLFGLALLSLLRPRAPDWLPDTVMAAFALCAALTLSILFSFSPDNSSRVTGMVQASDLM